MISIIIRTKNEERWIASCLRAVFDQTYKDFEVILVDNQSTDHTIEKASQFDIKIVNTDNYRPGNALNKGFEAAKGEYIVCLSGHCIPTHNEWLSTLRSNFDDPKVAGVYGRQEPMSFTSDFDKRDLLITFGLDKRVQHKDSFFHNANSMIRKDVWDKVPFDDLVTNIEDRLWAEQILKEGYHIIYEPDASVYHYHGIHQDRNPQRCHNIVRILENIPTPYFDFSNNFLNAEDLNIVAIIPVKGDVSILADQPLLTYTINRAKQSHLINQIIVSTDNPKTAEMARHLGAKVPFIREAKYSQPDVDLEQVFQYTLKKLEASEIFPDIIVTMEITYPFRSPELIDNLIKQCLREGLDTVVAGHREYNSCWIDDENYGIKRIDEGFKPRAIKKPIFKASKGLGCVTHVEFVREGRLFGPKVGIYQIDDPHSFIEVRSEKDRELADILMRHGRYEHAESWAQSFEATL